MSKIQPGVLGGLSGEPGQGFLNAKKGYGNNEIKRLEDPAGGSKKQMPTAVPSPFARFDLVATAFRKIADTPLLGAETDSNIASEHDKRLVSHTLDLAEFIFNSEAYSGSNLKILTWNKEKHLGELGKNPKHKKLAYSLELYLRQDAKTYNFDKMDNIYLFKYDNATTIGSTSPVTLFCPSASDLSDLGIVRMVDQKVAFGDDYLPLYKRSPEFQEWFYLLLAVYKKNEYYSNLESVSKYVDKSKELLQKNDNNIYSKIKSTLDSANVEDEYNKKYDFLKTGTNSAAEILKIPLRIAKEGTKDVSLQKSSYVIKSEKYNKDKKDEDKRLPLVLQTGCNFKDFPYIRGDFVPSTPVPNYVKGSWEEEREMPGIKGLKGRYLTTSDLLEPYLIRTIYPISSNFYTCGCLPNKDAHGYLLPLKKEFFQFFNIKDLKDGEKGVPEKPKFSINSQNNGNVEVKLEIPIQGNKFIIFKRIYKEGTWTQKPDEESLEGGIIVQAQLGLTIFPFVKVGKDDIVKYRVQLVDSDKKEPTECSLEFYKQENPISKFDTATVDSRQRSDKNNRLSTSKYYRINKEFDIIQFVVKVGDFFPKALIIPVWEERSYKSTSDKKFTFAVDFGTTNTNVAYKDSENAIPKQFYLDNAIATLFENSEKTRENIGNLAAFDIINLIDREFVPRNIGKENYKDNIFAFPQRTAIAYKKGMTEDEWNDGEGLDVLMEGNIPFGYEKTIQTGNEIHTDLKWKGGKDAREQAQIDKEVRAYQRQIIMLMQAKVLDEGGALNETKLIVFYPGSMDPTDVKELKKQWREYFGEYFFERQKAPEDNLVEAMESLAPFYAKNERESFGGGTVVSIDIGGGTTDVAVFVNPTKDSTGLKATTSFKFAGNAIFGDGNSTKPTERNGFVLRYAKVFEKKLFKGTENELEKPLEILNGLLKKKFAADINTFLFSIENSIEFWAKEQNVRIEKTTFSYTELLSQDHELSFLIIYFYTALLYHISKILKEIERESGEPITIKYLMFSGTASKMLNILEIEHMKKYTEIILKELRLNTLSLKVDLVATPKEITCYGGLMADISDLKKENDWMNNSNAAVAIASEPMKYTCIENRYFDKKITYSDYLSKSNLESIKKELIDFHEFLFKLNEDSLYNFKRLFGIPESVTKYVQNNYKRLIEDHTEDSISKNKSSDNKAYETPFFMPLKSIILDLSETIATGKIGNR